MSGKIVDKFLNFTNFSGCHLATIHQILRYGIVEEIRNAE